MHLFLITVDRFRLSVPKIVAQAGRCSCRITNKVRCRQMGKGCVLSSDLYMYPFSMFTSTGSRSVTQSSGNSSILDLLCMPTCNCVTTVFAETVGTMAFTLLHDANRFWCFVCTRTGAKKQAVAWGSRQLVLTFMGHDGLSTVIATLQHTDIGPSRSAVWCFLFWQEPTTHTRDTHFDRNGFSPGTFHWELLLSGCITHITINGRPDFYPSTSFGRYRLVDLLFSSLQYILPPSR